MDKPKTDKRKLVVNFILAWVVLGAFAIRYKGIAYGLPAITRQDEVTIMRPVLTMVQNRDANPHFFCYPSLFLYMQAGLCEAMVAYGNLLYDTANWAQAARWYARALARDSSRVQVLVDLGVCWYNQGDGLRARRAGLVPFCCSKDSSIRRTSPLRGRSGSPWLCIRKIQVGAAFDG